MRIRLSTLLGEALIAGTLIGLGAANAQTPAPTAGAATPIQHLVVIFQENISFDHYFGTYPFAMNPEGEPAFYAYPTTPSVNGLGPAFLNNNLTVTNSANGAGQPHLSAWIDRRPPPPTRITTTPLNRSLITADWWICSRWRRAPRALLPAISRRPPLRVS